MKHLFVILCCMISCLVLFAHTASADDVVEFLNGATVRGKVLEIRKDKKEFDFQVQVGNQKLTRTYSYDKVHAVTFGGKRHVLTEKPAGQTQTRSRQEVQRYIEEAGKTPPDWFETEPLDYPETLDLSWPLKPADQGWDNQRNVGQYIWDIVNPNPTRWQSGIKLVHHLTTIHKDQSPLMRRDMQTLGTMYFEFFQDYGRSAFWLQRAGTKKGNSMDGVLLAECYWRLGNKALALEILNNKTLHPQAIKLLGDMGETKRALDLAKAYGKSGTNPEAYLLAGDACRIAGRYDDAIEQYQKVIDGSSKARNEDYQLRYAARARESIAAIRLFDKADPSLVKDGTYNATTTGYSGPLEVRVKVASGRIESVDVIRHEEKQFYSAITDTTSQIIKKQSVKGIDATSRATITSQAIVNATAKAMAEGTQQ